MKTHQLFNISVIAAVISFTSVNAMADSKHTSHEGMTHSEMGATVDHSTMDHSSMNMEGMSDVGMPAPGSKPDKVVHVILDDDNTITFKKEVKIETNDVVQFVVMNVGDYVHEFSIGSEAEQIKHREMMKSMGNHEHDSGSAVTVQPGKAKQLLWHFHGQKEVELACNIPGHAEDGMVKHLSL
jgi:uncharacterized cupredoxin-like copper-binding protein